MADEEDADLSRRESRRSKRSRKKSTIVGDDDALGQESALHRNPSGISHKSAKDAVVRYPVRREGN